MSERKMPRNPGLMPDEVEHIPDSRLRYNPADQIEHHEPPFEPITLETYPDGRPKRGICGRDTHGHSVVPPNALPETMTGADLKDDTVQNELRRLGLQRWPMFLNPSSAIISERDAWQDESQGK